MKMVVNIKKYINCVIDVAIIFLILLGIFYIFQTTVLNKKYANIFGYTVFRVSTGSMSDEININDIILIKLTTDVSEKDIIAFEQDGGLIVHRIISKTEEYITTQGDANNYSDEPIKQDEVIGKVVFNISWDFLVKAIIIMVTLNITIYLLSKMKKHCKNESGTIERNDSRDEKR